jgi:glyceraldehyde 3-phosphate dehydrogenase
MENIGVNGFGRIGRYFTRLSLLRKDINVTVVNDLADIKTLAHLLKYDSVHGKLNLDFEIQGNTLHFSNGKKIIFTNEKNPESIPWALHNVGIVIESTGLFLSKSDAGRHLQGGAKKVIISAPGKGEDLKTVVLGVNDHLLDDTDLILSNASCTTNSAAPLLKVLLNMCEVENAYITTVHSYTSDQRLHDAPHSDLRRARAAAISIVPTSTGAAGALIKIFPQLEGRMNGNAFRVPVPDGSMTDLTLVVKNPPTVEEINSAMKIASEGDLKGILRYNEDPIVSIDIVGDPNSCIFDAELTSETGNLIKVVGWYDNEAGYSNRLIDLVLKLQH